MTNTTRSGVWMVALIMLWVGTGLAEGIAMIVPIQALPFRPARLVCRSLLVLGALSMVACTIPNAAEDDCPSCATDIGDTQADRSQGWGFETHWKSEWLSQECIGVFDRPGECHAGLSTYCGQTDCEVELCADFYSPLDDRDEVAVEAPVVATLVQRRALFDEHLLFVRAGECQRFEDGPLESETLFAPFEDNEAPWPAGNTVRLTVRARSIPVEAPRMCLCPAGSCHEECCTGTAADTLCD